MSEPGVTRVPDHPCPVCGALANAVGSSDGTDVAPRPGDLIVCAYCLSWLVITDHELTHRLLTNAEWLALSTEQRTHLTTLRARVERAWHSKGPR